MEVAPSPPNAVAGAAGGLSDAVHGTRGRRWASLALSIGALGVVYGDIGTSPLYTIQLIFTVHPLAPSEAHVYGALSLIFWSLVTVVTLKYVLVILRADNHGEGGIMALVALIQRSVTGGSRKLLVTLGVIGAALFYGDSMLTPAISVVSAVSGLQVVSPPSLGSRASRSARHRFRSGWCPSRSPPLWRCLRSSGSGCEPSTSWPGQS